MSRIGIMGGTFNPIHTGHLLLAEHVLEMVGLDQVWLIPTGCSYLKRKEGITVLSAEDRYRMVNLAIADNDRFRCLDMEIRRPGNSYSYKPGYFKGRRPGPTRTAAERCRSAERRRI